MVCTSGTLAGRNCIITGGSKGIGFAIAKLFFTRGANCLLISRNAARSNEAVAKLKADSAVGGGDGGNTVSSLAAPAGVQQHAFWRELHKTIWIKDHPPDVLVNAAGISQSSLLMRGDVGEIEHVVQTNLMGTMWACREVSKLMKRGGKEKERTANIINISSLLGVQGGRGAAAYAASKAGVLGLTRALAAEMGSLGVRVNAIVPGYITTGMTKGE